VTPEPDTGFTIRCQRLCPGFRALATLPARKSEVIVGELYDGTAVIAKQLARPNDVWDWYLKREIAIYRAFAAKPPPFRVPRLYAANDDVLVIERIDGEPLARRRSPLAVVDDLDGLLALRDRIATYEFPVTTEAPPAVHAQLRARFLEDPTDPAWIREGIARCAKRALIPPSIGARVIAYLDEMTAASHGDLLLRNVVGGVLVDWECAGPHLVDWDLALLWTQLAPAQRPIVEEAARTESFLGIVAFALCREVSFLHAYGKGPRHARLARITRELDDVCKRIE
jgi:Phosphotransferase enzyme family